MVDFIMIILIDIVYLFVFIGFIMGFLDLIMNLSEL